MTDSTDLLTAVITRLEDRSPSPRIYRMNDVPEEPTYPYSVAHVMPGAAGEYSLSGDHAFVSPIISVQSFGQDVDGALAYDDAAFDLLQNWAPTGTDAPLQRGIRSGVYRDPDDEGVVGVTSSFDLNRFQ